MGRLESPSMGLWEPQDGIRAKLFSLTPNFTVTTWSPIKGFMDQYGKTLAKAMTDRFR